MSVWAAWLTQHQDKLIRTVKLSQRGTGAVRWVERGGELEGKGHNNILNRKSVGKGKRVDPGGRGIIKKKKETNYTRRPHQDKHKIQKTRGSGQW